MESTKISDNVIEVIKVTPETRAPVRYDYDFLIKQRDAILAQRDKELAEINELIAECDKLGIVGKDQPK